ncbi:AsmA family protein [Vibrio rumoiensis]|uniref:AsmA domain-containing protein n=1 Tax=Vibrio rumoiensis 1S-45 TaxID=1188252 RepID=A0A1E5E5Z2_9VIBR|nr:AsmA family protein [Vibrio rumoiensis]OEF29436.1 hypothetical protein A1QC_04100 [Vibrio rumoiensis 1S-45]
MRKLLAIIVGLISLLVVALTASYAALHTKYAPQLVNGVLEYGLKQPIKIRAVNYSYQQPKHIQLEGVLIPQENASPLLLNQVDIWLGDSLWKDNQFQINNVLIEGVKLQNGWPTLSVSPYIRLNQLSVANIDFADNGWVGRDVNIQIKSPQVRDSKILPFYGEMQLSADQLYWQGEALNHVFIDGDLTEKNATFYDIRFTWRKAHFSGQATKMNTQKEWQVPRVNITGLRLQQNDFDNISTASLDGFNHIPMNIDQLTISESSFETPTISANNVTINAEHVELPLQLWQQQDASIFATADNMSLLGQAINSPALDVNLQPNLAHIQDISLEMLQGNIHLQGQVTPTSLNLTQLNLNNLKWIPSPRSKQLFKNYLSQIKNIQAKMVSVNNVQFIDLTTTTPKQASGLSIDGDELDIKRDGQWGLWNGQLSISASSASYDGVNSRNLLLSMHSKEGHFGLDKLFIPLDDGLVKGTANMAFSQTSQPWNVDLEASGIPLRFFTRWFHLPLHLDGITDFTIKGEGLYGDQLIFNRSVTGQLNASVTRASSHDDFQNLWLRNQGINLPPLVHPDSVEESEPEQGGSSIMDKNKPAEPVTISDIQLTADRGRLSLKPFDIEAKDFSAHFGGDYDFLYPDKGKLQYRLEGKCQSLTFNLLGKRDSVLVEESCK